QKMFWCIISSTFPEIRRITMTKLQITEPVSQVTKNVTNTRMNNVAQTVVAQVKKAGNGILNVLFPCRHRALSIPFTPLSKSGQVRANTYVKCLDCGVKYYYDWANMRIGKPMPKLPHAYSHIHLQALDGRCSSRGLSMRRV